MSLKFDNSLKTYQYYHELCGIDDFQWSAMFAMYRCSHFYLLATTKTSQNVQKTSTIVSFSIKFQIYGCNFIKNVHRRCFPCKFCKVFQRKFFTNQLWTNAYVHNFIISASCTWGNCISCPVFVTYKIALYQQRKFHNATFKFSKDTVFDSSDLNLIR